MTPQIFELVAGSMGFKSDASDWTGAQSVIVTATYATEEFKAFDNILAFIEGFTAVDCEHRESA
jgi:hypothetical protein